MKKKLISLILALVIVLSIFNFPAAALKTGDPLGNVLYSDIVAYIHGYAIPTSVINGKTLVAVEDLASYGFDVRWNSAARSLKVEPNENKPVSPLYVEKNYRPAGSVKCKYLYTDIKTYLSGELVESYAINGVTLIDFELLAKYGKIYWNGSAKELRFTIPVKSVALDAAQKTINRYDRFNLIATVLPANATDKKITYKTSNPNVATVSDYGSVYADGAGKATITAVSGNGIQAKCEVTVVVPVSAIYVAIDRYRYKTGETAEFKVVVYPEDATDKRYTVDITGSGTLSGDNKIYCPASGITAITVTAVSNGVSGTKEISVIDLEELGAEVFRLTNIERQKAGLPDLSYDEALKKTAVTRAKELVTFYSHTRPDGSECFTAFDENRVSYRMAGENIAWGQTSPEEVVNAWMNSPGHRSNILHKSFGRLGTGVEMDSKGNLYWSQNFTN